MTEYRYRSMLIMMEQILKLAPDKETAAAALKEIKEARIDQTQEKK